MNRRQDAVFRLPCTKCFADSTDVQEKLQGHTEPDDGPMQVIENTTEYQLCARGALSSLTHGPKTLGGRTLLCSFHNCCLPCVSLRLHLLSQGRKYLPIPTWNCGGAEAPAAEGAVNSQAAGHKSKNNGVCKI